jgi:hypothetical protein
MITINGIKCGTIEEVEAQIVGLSEEQKQMLRNDFAGIPNIQVSPVPSVTPRQMRIALVMYGIPLSTIDNMIDSLPEPNRSVARITWEYSIEFQRNNQLLMTMAPMLGLTSAQIDQLFTIASSL